MSSIGKLMRQAQRIQQEMERAKAELDAKTVQATSGGGAVTIVARCNQTIESIKINPEAFTPDDIGMLEDALLLALNDALGQAQKISEARMADATGGFNVPGL